MAKEKKEVIKKEIHVDEADAEKLLSALLQIAQEKSIDDKVDYNENYINDLKVLHKNF